MEGMFSVMVKLILVGNSKKTSEIVDTNKHNLNFKEKKKNCRKATISISKTPSAA